MMASCKGVDVDLLSDSGYTEELSILSPVEIEKKRESILKCPSLEFSDGNNLEAEGNHAIKVNETDENEKDEPQHILNSIIQKDVEYISRELTISDIKSDDSNDMVCLCPIHCLPREIMLKIFSYISQKELCSCVARVCKLWHEYAFDPSLWKIIDLHGYRDIPSVNLCRLIARASNLRTLILHGRDNISESEVTVFTDFTPNLQHLDIGFCHNVNDQILSVLVKKCPRLETINLEGVTSFKTGSLQILSRCTHLKNMNFSHSVIDNGDLHHLAKHLEKIQSINIDGISWIVDEPVIYLAQSHKEWLQELAIDGAEITDECYEAISCCTNLTSFESSFCELLTNKSLQYLQNLTKLKNLRLRKGTDFTTGGLITLFSSAAVTQLTSLDLSECTGCEDSCVLQIAKSCGRTLKRLSLCWCWNITDLGATSIVDHCSNLVNLDLTGIDKMNGDCFGRVPSEMPHLKLLDLKQCNRIKDELIESAVRQKKDLIAINYYGEELQYGVTE